MLVPALGLFVVAALFGLYMLARVLKGQLPPWFAAILHGLFAATGLVLVLYAVITGSQPTAVVVAAALLVLAALGGFILVSFHLRSVAPPKALAVVHALAAVGGVGALAASVLGYV